MKPLKFSPFLEKWVVSKDIRKDVKEFLVKNSALSDLFLPLICTERREIPLDFRGQIPVYISNRVKALESDQMRKRIQEIFDEAKKLQALLLSDKAFFFQKMPFYYVTEEMLVDMLIKADGDPRFVATVAIKKLAEFFKKHNAMLNTIRLPLIFHGILYARKFTDEINCDFINLANGKWDHLSGYIKAVQDPAYKPGIIKNELFFSDFAEFNPENYRILIPPSFATLKLSAEEQTKIVILEKERLLPKLQKLDQECMLADFGLMLDPIACALCLELQSESTETQNNLSDEEQFDRLLKERNDLILRLENLGRAFDLGSLGLLVSKSKIILNEMSRNDFSFESVLDQKIELLEKKPELSNLGLKLDKKQRVITFELGQASNLEKLDWEGLGLQIVLPPAELALEESEEKIANWFAEGLGFDHIEKLMEALKNARSELEEIS